VSEWSGYCCALTTEHLMAKVVCACRICRREGSIIAGQRETASEVSTRMIIRIIRR